MATLTRENGTSAAAVGRRVRVLREARGLSLRDLAGRSGVSAPMLSQVERGETSPTIAVAQRIAGGLDLPLSTLLRLDERQQVSLVRKTARRNERPCRNRPNTYPRQPSSSAIPLNAHSPITRTGHPGRSVTGWPVSTVNSG